MHLFFIYLRGRLAYLLPTFILEFFFAYYNLSIDKNNYLQSY